MPPSTWKLALLFVCMITIPVLLQFFIVHEPGLESDDALVIIAPLGAFSSSTCAPPSISYPTSPSFAIRSPTYGFKKQRRPVTHGHPDRDDLNTLRRRTMAWRSSGSTNAGLVANLARNGVITSDRVQQAMLAVDRAHYAPAMPYEDSPQGIGHGATISAPHMHAAACEALLPFLHGDARVLDVGSGSGYLTHVLAHLVAPGGTVVGIDHIQGLVDLSQTNTAKSDDGRQLLRTGRLRYVRGDGRQGFPAGGPYDAIHVGAAAAEAHPALIAQLKAPGRMFIPVGRTVQHVWVIDKTAAGAVERSQRFGVRYVPLTDAPPAAEERSTTNTTA